jgi:hypothetical protein
MMIDLKRKEKKKNLIKSKKYNQQTTTDQNRRGRVGGLHPPLRSIFLKI